MERAMPARNEASLLVRALRPILPSTRPSRAAYGAPWLALTKARTATATAIAAIPRPMETLPFVPRPKLPTVVPAPLGAVATPIL